MVKFWVGLTGGNWADMPKQQLKKWLPSPEMLKEHRLLRCFAPWFADPRLWHFNRRSLERAVVVGVIAAFVPLPAQMFLAVLFAFLVRANVPMSVGLTWLTNPLTTLPVFWAAYWVGAKLLGEAPIGIAVIGQVLSEVSAWVMTRGEAGFGLHHVFSLKVFLVGLLVSAVLTSLVLGAAFRLFWRHRVAQEWKKRRKKL